MNDERNITWQVNQKVIQETYLQLIQELKRCPTTQEVSERAKLSVSTIDKHIAELKFEPVKNPLRTLTPDVIVSIYNSARKGNSASQKLWFQLMEGWSESQEIKFKNSIADLILSINDEK